MKSNRNGDIVKGLAMITQLGMTVLIPAGLFLALGLWLDQRYGWSVTVPLLILGILGGAKGAYDLAKGMIKGQEDDDEIKIR
ncbi:MAG: AtpZ/AtpI family protein [Lachnospiraceae bacterium]|nr:AtpZ/AtpI family protein [Lachnospiraceae bacterium]